MRRPDAVPWMFVGPALVAIGVVIYYPLFSGIQLSFRDVRPAYTTSEPFVGLQNYSRVLQDENTQSAIVQTGIYLVGAGTLELLLATAFALALNGRFKLRGAAFAVLLLPWALPPVVAAVAWRRFWTADNGILNGLLEAMNLIDSPASWLGSIEWARVAIILAHVWVVTPFITMILLAGLQTIPAHLYDAANVDGASTARQFRSITLPLMRPSYAVAATVASIIALAIFDEIYVLTGQAVETRSVLMQVYLTTFGALNFGQGAALALLVAVSSAFIAMVYLRVLRRAEQ